MTKKAEGAMLSVRTFMALVVGSLLGSVAGFYVGNKGARLAIITGPYSDDLRPALNAIDEAQTKLDAGNCDVSKHLELASVHLRHSIEWTNRFTDGQTSD